MNRDLNKGVDLLFDSKGIEVADQLSIRHILLAVENLLNMKYHYKY